jgi:type IV secretory pathway TrbD component
MGLNITFMIPIIMPFVFQFMAKIICLFAGLPISPISLATVGFIGAGFGVVVWACTLILEFKFTINDLRDLIEEIKREIQ